MTQTGYTSAIVNAMLGWLKGLASWVLKLFNLSGGFSPLKFLADNWLQLLIFFLILGVAIDLLVWLIRWRPHWVWFRKKRVIINDANFFDGEDEAEVEDDWVFDPVQESADRGGKPRRDWEDSDFVVPGEARRRRDAKRREEEDRRHSRSSAHVKSMQLGAEESGSTDVFTDGLFNVNAKQKFSDRYEDEVFSVKDLPGVEGDDLWQEANPAPESRSRKVMVHQPAEKQRRAKPAKPGTFKVPGSRRSGKSSGMVCSRDWFPVPPCISGSVSPAHSSRPVPWGPSSPLCPGIAMKEAPSTSRFTGKLPADWAASRIKGTPRSRHSCANCSTGRI